MRSNVPRDSRYILILAPVNRAGHPGGGLVPMGLFQSPTRQALKPHVHVAEEQCPWCEQPISHAKFEDIRRRMTAEQNERLAALAQQFERDKAETEAKAK